MSIEIYPSDILLKIFEYLVPSDPTELKRKNISLSSLRAVCSYWNAVITSSPLFWSLIPLRFPTQIIPTPMLELWLARSADASLLITVDDVPPINWSPDELRVRSEMMSAINPQLPRCKSLQLDVTVGILPGFTNLQLSKAERLKDFVVNMRGTMDEHVHTIMIQQLISLRSLLHLSLTSHSPFVVPCLLKFSTPTWLSQLITIEVRCPIISHDALELLSLCTSAIHITLDRVRSSVNSSSVPLPLSYAPPSKTLSNLESLDITVTSNDAYYYLTQHLFLPNIHTFKISGVDITSLYSTIPFYTSSSKLANLYANLTSSSSVSSKNTIASLTTLLHDASILRIPTLTISSGNFETWDEYNGWAASLTSFELSANGENGGIEQSLEEMAEELNRSHSNGSQVMKLRYLLEYWDKGYSIGWTDEGGFVTN